MTQTRERFPEFGEVTAAQVEVACGAAVAACDAIVAGVVECAGRRTAANTLLALEDALDVLETAVWGWTVHRHVAVAEDVRAAARDGYTLLQRRLLGLRFDPQIHDAVEEFAATREAAGLTGEQRRLLEQMVRDGRRDGFALPEAERRRVRALFDELVELETEFQRGIADWEDAVDLTRDELAGLPEAFVEGLERVADGRYRVPVRGGQVVAIATSAESPAVRQELWARFYRKGGPENVAVLERMIAVRDGIARGLGYDSWAAYQVEPRMAGRRETVDAFLEDLRVPLAAKAATDRAEAAGVLRAAGLDDAVPLWDHRYALRRLRRARYAVDDAEIAAYFPLDAVLDGMLSVTGELFGVRFDAVPDAAVWHPEVRVYDITDTGPADGSEDRPGDGREGGPRREPFARFFLDLLPRPHKYPHAAVAQLVKARRRADGSYRAPMAVLFANFARPSGDLPSLLTHEHVEVLFHEFGHVLHKTLSLPELPSFSSGQCEREFVEAPSQLMEHWAWHPDVLARFARHHRTGEPLPRAVMVRMTAARTVGSGITYLRQVTDSRLDFAFHSPGFDGDSTALSRAVQERTGYVYPPGSRHHGGWTHMTRLDAAYYGYLWSQALGDDMFTVFERTGPLDRAAGQRLRRLVLEPGASRDAAAMVRAFLGREPDNEAFLRRLGLGADGTA